MPKKTTKIACLAWFAAALFYAYQYSIRVAPGIMIYELRVAFQVRAEEFATLASLYLLAYSVMQIPLGILIDKFNVRRVVLVSIAMCITGTVLAAVTRNFTIMQCSRVMIGIGSAAAFMSTLKIVTDNFSSGNRGLLMGATLTMGTIGALCSGTIVNYALNHESWRDVWWIYVTLGSVIFVFAFWTIHDNNAAAKVYAGYNVCTTATEIWHEVLYIIQDRKIMLYAIIAVGLYSPLITLADIWGTAFLKLKFSLDRADAAYAVLTLYVGMGIGSILLPWICEKRSVLDRGIAYASSIIMLGFGLILYGPVLSYSALVTVIFVLGIACGAEVLCFTAAVRRANPNNSGEILGIVNTFNMLGSAALGQFIGLLLDLQWDGMATDEGLRVYSLQDFTVGMSSLTIVLFICWLMTFLLEKKY